MKRYINGLVGVALVLLASPLWAQDVVRGPYLQSPSDTGIIVRWRTDLATDSVVRYGTDSASLAQTESVAGSRTEHTVVLTGLDPATQYFYSVGDGLGPLAGDATFHFHTAPVPGTAAPTRVWLIGDSGTANASARAVRDAFKIWTASSPADFMIMLGDNAYNDGTDAEYQAAVFDTYPELLRQLPLWSTLGNHDGHTADSATQSGPYYDIFDFPTAGEIGGLASGTEAYFSWDYGNIHFVNLDSYETDRSVGGNMLTWLESDLATNNQPWVICIFHHPPYTKGSHDSDTEGNLIDMRQNALPILEAWGVDLVLSGHSHSYERSYLLDGHYGSSGTLDPVANVLDPGDGSETGDGAYEKPDIVAAEHEGAVYTVAGSSGKISGGSLDHPAMYVSLNFLGSVVLDVAGNRLDATFIDDTGLVRDEYTLLKTPDIQPPLIDDVTAEDASHVRVDFSERLDVASAGNTANYAISGLAIGGAEVLAGSRSVRLSTSSMTPGQGYVLTVDNVEDESGNPIAANSQFAFDFVQQVTVSFQDGLAPDPSYAGTRDTYIREASATTNYGTAATLQVDGDEPSGAGTDMSIVISWDTSAIPATAIVDSASIFLNTLNVGGPYSCYPLLRSWAEEETTWNLAAAGQAWGAPGAAASSDRDSGSVCNFNAGSTGQIEIVLNGDGIAMLQDWVDGSLTNHGIVISDPASTNGADFDSSESTTAMSRPRLQVTYTVPVSPPDPPPAAPSGLVATPFSGSSIDLAWSDNANDEDGFLLQRASNAAGPWADLADLATDSTSYRDSGLASGTTRYYRVRAYNAGGSSADSNMASATTFANPRSIQFSGRSWTVKGSSSPVGPGPNYFGDTADDVWVDQQGYLHLRIEYRDGQWHSSEVITDDVLGHGTYTFVLGTRVDLLDRNTVVGLFTWDSFAPSFNYREIDIEFSRWGDPLNDNSQYVVQPYTTAGNIHRWETGLAGTDSTHAFTWRPDSVDFNSYQGDPAGAVIQSWTYSGPDVPPEGTTSGNARINFWLFGGSAPFDGQEAELVVKSFDFEPLPVNLPPVAAFDPDCVNLDCTFTDTSSDADGSISSWSWDFGDGMTSSEQNPSHGYAAAGDYSVQLTVADDGGAEDSTSMVLSVSEPQASTDVFAIADISGSGTVSGDYMATHEDDGVAQSITERQSGGKKQDRHSYLVHGWQFNVPPNALATVHVNAWSSGSSDDDFRFSWSANGSNYSEMFVVSSTDPNNVQSFMLPAGSSGTIYLRVEDTDQTPGNQALDTIHVDQALIRAELAQGNPPAAPSTLSAAAAGSSQIDLSWLDNSSDESGFTIERSTDGTNFFEAGIAAADDTGFSDTGLAQNTTYWYRVNAFNASGASAYSNTATAKTAEASLISLVLSGYKVKGAHHVDLAWTGTSAANVDIYRDGALLVTVPDNGSHTDVTSNKGARIYTYQVCEAGTANCSDIASVSF